MKDILENSKLIESLNLRDLTNPLQGEHAMQLLLQKIIVVSKKHLECDVQIHRKSPVVRLQENYDLLNYPTDGASRDSRYTKYISEDLILRTQTSSMIPSIVKDLALYPLDKDTLMVCPGIVYRRDVIDKLHVSCPHQLDLWLISEQPKTKDDLVKLIDIILNALIPNVEYMLTDAVHPYTTSGVQIDVKHNNQWVEVGECGLASTDVLNLSGKPLSGLAMGLGLDRLLMIVKDLNDIRLIRDTDERVQSQMLTLKKYKSVSKMPAASKDISIAVDKDMKEEEIGSIINEKYPHYLDSIEEIKVLSETSHEQLPEAAIKRMGLSKNQKNLLLRIVIRNLSKTLTMEEAKAIRNDIYKTLHMGSCSEGDYL